MAGQGRAVVGDAQTKATDDSGRLSDVSTTQVRTIAKDITSRFSYTIRHFLPLV